MTNIYIQRSTGHRYPCSIVRTDGSRALIRVMGRLMWVDQADVV